MSETSPKDKVPADEIDESFAPRPRGTVASVVVDDEAVIYDGRTGSVHLLNPTASVLWQCFDGSGTIGELTIDVKEAYGIDAETASRDVMDVVRHVGRLGLLEGIARDASIHDESPMRTATEL